MYRHRGLDSENGFIARDARASRPRSAVSSTRGPASTQPSPGVASNLPLEMQANRNGPSVFESHAALLGDPKLLLPAYARRQAAIVQQIQRDYGNRYVQRLFDHAALTGSLAAQTELAVEPAGDKHEREAGTAARGVTSVISARDPDVERPGPDGVDIAQRELAVYRQGSAASPHPASPLVLQRYTDVWDVANRTAGWFVRDPEHGGDAAEGPAWQARRDEWLPKFEAVQTILSDIRATQAALDALNQRHLDQRLLDPGQTLSQTLAQAEQDKGFSVTLPIMMGYVHPREFIDMVKRGQLFEDWVDAAHGSLTHRIQWYIVGGYLDNILDSLVKTRFEEAPAL